MERWDENYKYNEEIEGAYDDDLLEMAKESDDADFASACLHDLAWRQDAAWDENEELHEIYNRLLSKVEEDTESATWDELFPGLDTEEIKSAEDAELLKWAEDAESWGDFSKACLWEICYRHDLGWYTINRYWDLEDADEKLARVKKQLAKSEEA